MKNILTVFAIISLSSFHLLAQGDLNPMERKNKLRKLKSPSFSNSEGFTSKLGAKKLTMKPFNSFQKNIGVYKNPNKILSKGSISQGIILKKLQLGLVHNMPIAISNKKYYMPTVDPINPAIHNHILIGKIGQALPDLE